ncbi:Uncharacterised protein [Clostridium carnis]|uniref:Uncharacterized protein n=1 Tax=Clostridium carnis TaxID=1530 RepID=A0ABY6T0L2_9CLOT|nr:hypothetical protein [Clostridium carnis]VDG74592.1 Uncharacterised protein [Clostridium carnis]
MDYKHGLYGEIIASNESIVTSKNIPVYVGIAPMHRLNDRAINKPILIRNLQEAIRKLDILVVILLMNLLYQPLYMHIFKIVYKQ